MINIRIVLLSTVTLLTGCIQNNYNPDIIHPDIVYVSDSRCAEVWDTGTKYNELYDDEAKQRTAQNEVGIVSFCKKRRKLMDINELPKGYRMLFLDLGTNDVIGGVPVDTFKQHYYNLISNSDAEIIYCVLPNYVILGRNAEPYRDAIRELCGDMVVDPRDYGVLYRAKDTVHMIDKDHKAWEYGLWKIINFGLGV